MVAVPPLLFGPWIGSGIGKWAGVEGLWVVQIQGKAQSYSNIGQYRSRQAPDSPLQMSEWNGAQALYVGHGSEVQK
jgi:hypothetical protein